MNKVARHFDNIAGDYDFYKKRSKFYYDNLKKLLSELIPKDQVVLEIGCGTGDLISAVKPKIGYGIDISSKMVEIAQKKYQKNKNLYFSTKKVLEFKRKKLGYIFMSDVIEHLENPEKMFADINEIMSKKTILIVTMANPCWELLLLILEKIGWKMPEGPHWRRNFEDISKLLGKLGLRVIKHDYRLLLPVKLPLLTCFANNYLEKLYNKYAFIEYFVSQKK